MLEKPTSLTLRTELETLALQDLLGPAGGETEVVEEPTVRGRYILGILAPRGQSAQPEEQDELAEGGADTQDGKAPSPRALNNAMFPSSMGLTFSVDGAAKELTITAQWGRYQRVRSETLRDHKGDFKLVWQRTPVRGEQTFALQAGRLGPWYPDPENDQVYVDGRVR